MQLAVDRWKFPLNVLGALLRMVGFSRAIDQLTRLPEAMEAAPTDA